MIDGQEEDIMNIIESGGVIFEMVVCGHLTYAMTKDSSTNQ